MSEPNAKRCRTAAQSHWEAIITSTGPIASVAKAVKCLATNVTLEILKNETSEGINIQVMDAGQVCMYAAHVHCEISIDDQEEKDFKTSFTVCSDLLDTVIGAANQPAYMLKFFPVANNTKIEFHVRENVGADGQSSGTGYSSKMTLSTRNADSAHSSLKNWNTDYAAFMSTNALKTFLKRAQKFQAERIKISIFTMKDSDDTSQFLVSLCANDPSSGCEIVDTFMSQQNDANEACEGMPTVFATPTSAEINMHLLDTKYSEEFSPTYLAQFLKSNDRDNVYLKLTNDSPLVCFVELGNDSNLSLVLAPLEKE